MNYEHICSVCMGWMSKLIEYYKCSTCGNTKENAGRMEPMKTKTYEEAKQRYGEIKDGKWADEGKWMVVFKVPDAISQVVTNSATGKPWTKIYCNKDLIEPLTNVFNELISSKVHDELKIFDGCFMIRSVRGYPDKQSTHSFGIALDFRAQEMPLNAKNLFSQGFIDVWKKHGFTWGGDFKRLDCQHFQFAAW